MISFVPLRGIPVSFGELKPEIIHVINLASEWGRRAGKVVQVTSGNDKVHMANSFHYKDLAVDLDVKGNSTADLQRLYRFLVKFLDPRYDVVFEGNHIHCELDVKDSDFKEADGG